jgi:hypothetical protein
MAPSPVDVVALRTLWPALDERQRRLAAGALADAVGHGGITFAARELGLSRRTVSAGLAEVHAGVGGSNRVRREGGGPPKSPIATRGCCPP